MRRRLHRSPAFALALLAAAAAGCADYQFNEVNRCLIQPGSKEVALPNIHSADVLFVVDDSGSMAGKQAKLAAAFDTFVGSLNDYDDVRAAANLEPFDFHIAITTSSVFYNQPTSATCKATCGSSTDVCGTVNGGICSPMRIPKACPSGTGCGSGFSCKSTCAGYAGQAICCDGSGANVETTTVACTDAESATTTVCGKIQERYAFNRTPKPCATKADCTTSPYTVCTDAGATKACGSYPGSLCCSPNSCLHSTDCATGFSCGSYTFDATTVTSVCVATSGGYPDGTPQLNVACVPGVGEDGALYPQGDFVGAVTTTGRVQAQGPNPRVLHFDKSLYATDANGVWDPVANKTTATNRQGFTRAELKGFFESSVHVGTCGSGQEQVLQAARLAVSKALSGQQFDVVGLTTTTRVAPPGVAAAWPHAGAKLVVVYVGDEDDCSAPADPVRGVILTGAPPNDACWHDAFNDNGTPKPVDQQKEFRVSDFVSSLQALDRPIGAAFVVSATSETCEDASCVPDVCAPDPTCLASFPANQCGGVAPGTRLLAAGTQLRGAGSDVIDASICNSDFGTILGRIAQIVKPPQTLTIPTQPASGQMTLLRITNPDGTTRKVCKGPALPQLPVTQAKADGYDWWFVDPAGATTVTLGPTQNIFVNHETNQCEANPGEGYSADYLGMVPPAGCVPSGLDTAGDGPGDGACRAALGNAVKWTCYAGTDALGVCLVPTISASSGPGPGTCLCNPRSVVCPNGP